MFEHVRAGQGIFSKEITDAGFELVQEEAAPFLTENYVVRFRKVEKAAAQSLLLPRVPSAADRSIAALD